MHPDLSASRLDPMLEALWRAQATDLILTTGIPPQIRVNGQLSALSGEPDLVGFDTDSLLAEVLSDTELKSYEDHGEYDFSFSWRDEARIRGSAFRQRGSTAVALRIIPRELPTLESLGIPHAVGDLMAQHQGLVLVTGPTGAGKSTSLAAMVNQINLDRACHILTIEDPIEYLHPHKRSTVNQREVGTDTASFPTALRAALREDPDVILVGEMRDLESIRFALTLAETGHLVLATLHTNDTSQALARIIDVFPGEQQDQIRVQLAGALSAIMYQRLLPLIGGGMVAAYEVLIAIPAVRNLIKEGKTNQLRNQLVTGHRDGMVTFEQSLSSLIQAGKITLEDAALRSLYPKDIEARPRPQRLPA